MNNRLPPMSKDFPYGKSVETTKRANIQGWLVVAIVVIMGGFFASMVLAKQTAYFDSVLEAQVSLESEEIKVQ